jgi:metal-responsive CopG/Arc/MetJ family transcriptional regulator
VSELNVGAKKGLKKKMSISIEVDVLEEFNKLSKLNKYNKSQTVSNLIKAFIENEKSLIK